MTSVGYFVYLIVGLLHAGVFFSPPADNDELYFEILAANIADGNGFSGEITENVLTPYRKVNEKGAWDFIILEDGPYRSSGAEMGIDSTTTYRPPLYPATLALVYKLFGRHFFLYRVLNSILMAIGLGLVILVMSRIAGFYGAVVALLFALIDPGILIFARLGLSEGMAFFWVSLLAYILLVKTWIGYRHAALCGLVLGFLILTRPVFVFWCPFVGLLIFYDMAQNRSLREGLLGAFLTVGITLVIYLPWAIRNSIVMESFMPLGSQGGLLLGGTYNDKIMERRGSWTVLGRDEFIKSFQSAASGTERERELAQAGYKKGVDWIYANIELIPRILLMRTVSLWWQDTALYQRFLILLCIPALIFCAFDKRIVFLALIVAHSAAIALTSNSVALESDNPGSARAPYGRFLFSLEPIMIIVASMGFLGIVKIIHRLKTRLAS